MLWNILAKNPFRSLKEHMTKSLLSAEKTRDLFKALFAKDVDSVNRISKEISKIEHECDVIKQKIRANLSKSVFLPVERRDIMNVLSNMDSIADNAEDIGVLLTMRWMELPKELEPVFWNLLESNVAVVRDASKVIEALDNLLEAGFSGPDASKVRVQIDEIDRLEHVADKMQDMFCKGLFAKEDEIKPAALFMWLKIGNKVGNLANSSERMVNYIRLMLSSS